MANLISTLVTAGLPGDNLRLYTDVLRADSAIVAATVGAGGTFDPSVDFREHTVTVVNDDGLPTVVAENGDKPAADAVVAIKKLNVELWAKFRQISRQAELTKDPAQLAQEIVSSAGPGFPIAFDVRHLGTIAAGASVTSVEYDAADPISSMSSLFAAYDETSYAADGLILTRAGARKLGYAVDGNGRLQSPGGVQGLANVPTYLTGATGTQLGVASLMGIVGPFGAGSAASAIGLGVERMPQATINGVGPEQNIVNYRIESASGYVNAIDAATPDGTGFSILIDAV